MNISSLVDQLNEFESPDAIAEFLQSKGVKGYRAEASACPISNWIHLNVEILDAVTEDTLKVWYDSDISDYEEFFFSDNVIKFIERVDNYDYPELLIKEEF